MEYWARVNFIFSFKSQSKHHPWAYSSVDIVVLAAISASWRWTADGTPAVDFDPREMPGYPPVLLNMIT